MSFIHLFTVRNRAFQSPSIDSLLVIDNDKHEMIMDYQLFEAVKELSKLPDNEMKMIEYEHNRINLYYNSTTLRLRFNSDIYPHILKLTSPVEFSMDEMDVYIKSIPDEDLESKFREMEI